MDERLPRKLAAILYADVAGYSRLTGDDEDGTHRQMSAHLDFLADTIRQHTGRVSHYAGDAVLAEFPTVSEALSCATEFQQALTEQNSALPEERRVQFRVGINLGEVIVDRGDLYGDGVNVAARLEGLAEPGGICVSEAVRSAAGRKLPVRFEFMGEQEVKNITEPVRAYSVRWGDEPVLAAPVAKSWLRRGVVAAGILAIVVIAIFVLLQTVIWDSPPAAEAECTDHLGLPIPADKCAEPGATQ